MAGFKVSRQDILKVNLILMCCKILIFVQIIQLNEPSTVKQLGAGYSLSGTFMLYFNV